MSGRAAGLVLNAGTEPALPPVPGLAGAPYWTNREAVETGDVPESLIVPGGGAGGAELAQVFARFGARVTVVEPMARLLPMEEPEAGELLEAAFTRDGIDLRTGARAERVSHDGQAFTLELAGGEALTAQRPLVASGRRAALAAPGVGAYGVDEMPAAVATDERMRAADMLGRSVTSAARAPSPTCRCSRPAELPRTSSARADLPPATAPCPGRRSPTPRSGLGTGRGAGPRPGPGRAGRDHAVCRRRRVAGTIRPATTGFIKLIQDARRGVLVGAASAGPAGGEVLGALVVAVHGQVPVADLRTMIYACPPSTTPSKPPSTTSPASKTPAPQLEGHLQAAVARSGDRVLAGAPWPGVPPHQRAGDPRYRQARRL